MFRSYRILFIFDHESLHLIAFLNMNVSDFVKSLNIRNILQGEPLSSRLVFFPDDSHVYFILKPTGVKLFEISQLIQYFNEKLFLQQLFT